MSDVRATTLPGGVRIVTDRVAGVDSAALGIWVDAGTRDEDLQHNGAAHMTEHMLFKGTRTRSAQDIVQAIEDVGGHMNAYTSREVTSYHVHVLKDDAAMAFDVLGDMFCHSVMPDEEIERERDVILQEIGMCHDTPDDLIFDHYYETAWPDQSLGAPILGTADIISSMSKEALQAYMARTYTAGRIVVSAAGDINHDDIVDQAARLFGDMPSSTAQSQTPAVYQGGEHRAAKDLEQSHIILGFKAMSHLDDDYIAGRLISILFGGGMSSRLFQEIREKRGLVYAVYSFYSAYKDDGSFGIYAGTGPDKIDTLIPVLCDEIARLPDTIEDKEFRRAKAQYKAGILMGRESMMRRANQNAKHMINYKEALDTAQIIQKIDAVTPEDLARTARRIFDTPHTVSALGPLDRLESYADIGKRLKG